MKKNNYRFWKSPSLVAFLLSSVILIWSLFNIGTYKQAESDANYLINHDVQQYYSYLPAAFIYDDLTFKFLESDTIPDKIKRHFWVSPAKNKPEGRIVKMSIGLSYMYLPFFAAGHLYARQSGTYAANGFSLPYEFALAFSSIFFVLVGLLFSRSVLLHYFNEWVTAIALLLILFATNLYYYCTTEPAMSHAYLFCLYAFFIHQSLRWIAIQKWKHALWLGIIGGIIICIRPINLLIFLFPLLFGVTSVKDLSTRIQLIFSHYFQLLLLLLLIFLMILPQLLFWKLNSGEWIYYSYSDEGFFFSNPQIVNGLFSYRKGWFVYTPIMLFAFIGMRWVWYTYRDWFWPIMVYMTLHIYVVFSWWCWWYGGSYGARPMIETYALMIIPLAVLLQHILTLKSSLKIPVGLVLGFLIYLNLVQTQQKRLGLIHWDGMTQTAYWRNFLTLHDVGGIWDNFREPNYDAAKKGASEYNTIGNEMRFLISRGFFEHYKPKMDTLADGTPDYNNISFFKSTEIYVSNRQFSLKKPSEIGAAFNDLTEQNLANTQKIYTSEHVIPYVKLENQSNTEIVLRISALFYVRDDVTSSQPTLVCKLRNKEIVLVEKYVELEKDTLQHVELEKWTSISTFFKIPNVEPHDHHNIQVFGWLRGKGSFLIDSISVSKIEQINP
jgi:septum formation topological specificity factor MinE